MVGASLEPTTVRLKDRRLAEREGKPRLSCTGLRYHLVMSKRSSLTPAVTTAEPVACTLAGHYSPMHGDIVVEG